MQRLHQGSAVRKKMVIKVHKSYKLAQLSLRLGLREISNSLNFLRESSDTLSINVMIKKIEFCDAEYALIGIDNNVMHGKTIKNSSQILEVLLWVGTSNEDIINVGVG